MEQHSTTDPLSWGTVYTQREGESTAGERLFTVYSTEATPLCIGLGFLMQN